MLATALGVGTAVDGGLSAPALVGAGLAIVLLLVALTAARSAPIPIALLILGAVYAIPDDDRTAAAPIFASALLLTAELAYWSLDERVHQRLQAGVLMPRLLAILAIAAAAIPPSALVLVTAEAGVGRSAATTAAGGAAIVACIALLTSMIRPVVRRACRSRPRTTRTFHRGVAPAHGADHAQVCASELAVDQAADVAATVAVERT